ncbi:MAG: 3-phosphoshikimate 1-carboxyvinyltransferase [bacterium]|nr:3-phosphoshikimate 1-carboxyvinyltransferase [bacterium]
MKSLLVKPEYSALRGEIKIPGDKSITHRAIMLSSLVEGTTLIKGASLALDCLNTLKAFNALGIETKRDEESLVVHGKGLYGLGEPEDIIDVGNSGTTMRLILGILAAQDFYAVLTGDESLRKRPMRRVIEPLQKMGASLFGRANGNYPPITVKGNPALRPISYHTKLPSAQVKSAILLAGLFARGETSVTESMLSRDHTERMLRYLGVNLERDGLKVIIQGPSYLKGREVISVAGDISSASFLIVLATLVPGSSLWLRDVGINPTRTGIIDVLRKMGGNIKIVGIREECGEPIADIYVEESRLRGVSIGNEEIPRLIDEIPIIAVASCFADGVTKITGASELRVKETDRISAIVSSLRKMGADISELKDGMIIQGGRPIKGGEVESFGDHRTAMSLVIAGLLAKGETKVSDVDCIDTSFPGFVETINSILDIPSIKLVEDK